MPFSMRRILSEATSAALTVSLTDCMRFCAFPINISVASASSSEPEFEKDKTNHAVAHFQWIERKR